MQIKTERGLLNIGNSRQPVVRVALTPKAPSGHLVAGITLGLVLGFVLGSVVALSVGDKGLSLAQELWERVFNAESDGEKVHFELLLQ